MPVISTHSIKKRSAEHAIDQLRKLDIFEGKDLETLEDFLNWVKIEDLSDLDSSMLLIFRNYIKEKKPARNEKGHFDSLLERLALVYLEPYYKDLIRGIDAAFPSPYLLPVKNKLKAFLMLNCVTDPSQITYQVRCTYDTYLRESGFKNRSEYVKLLDRLKLTVIEKENQKAPFKKPKITYRDEVFYLGYHPDLTVAKEFYYLRDKEELVFDFSLDVSSKLKKQVFSMLNHILSLDMKRKNRRELYLVPLKKLYLYAAENKIEDLEQLSAAQVEGFRRSMEGKVGTKTNTYMQIVHSIRKYLFLSADQTNWDANVWFLERFSFKDGRKNPASNTEAFRFDQICLKENQAVMKQYMKNQIGISSRAIASVLFHYEYIKDFLFYCDREKAVALSVSADVIDRYFASIEKRCLRETTFNRIVSSILDFYRYLEAKKLIAKVPFCAGYYIKKTFYQHNDRSVSAENQMSFLLNLKYFPENLRLMCLHLWATGIRVNEVCTIRGDAYSFDGRDAYLTVRQYKVSADKKIPIPSMLYQLMSAYISKNAIGAEEYVFQNRSGGAYQRGTFLIQVKKLCVKYQIGDPDYVFKSHDFRHQIATDLFNEGVSLQAIREYHGHRDESMTKQYIDFLPRKRDDANRYYFIMHRQADKEAQT